jgi:hypothetical protein
MRPIGQYLGLSQYPGPWIHVARPSGGQFVGQFNVPQVPIATIIEVKLESMVRAVRRTYKKRKRPLLRIGKMLGRNPTR